MNKDKKLTPLQEQVVQALSSYTTPCLYCQDLSELGGIHNAGGALAGLRKRGIVSKRNAPTRHLNVVRIPGKFIGQWNVGLVTYIERKSHWFLVTHKDQAKEVWVVRLDIAKKALAEGLNNVQK